MGAAPEEEAILESLSVPIGGYNEWRIRGAIPIGVFVAKPQCILAKQESTFTVGEETLKEIGSALISLQATREASPSLPFYTMEVDRLEKLQI